MKQYSFLEEKHNLLWKFFYGKNELARLRGMRRTADQLNKEISKKTIDKVNPIRSSEFLKNGKVKRYFSDKIVHEPYESGFGKDAMYHPGWAEKRNIRLTSEPTDRQLRKIGKGKIKPQFADREYTDIDELYWKLSNRGWTRDEIWRYIDYGIEPYNRGGGSLIPYGGWDSMGLGLGY